MNKTNHGKAILSQLRENIREANKEFHKETGLFITSVVLQYGQVGMEHWSHDGTTIAVEDMEDKLI